MNVSARQKTIWEDIHIFLMNVSARHMNVFPDWLWCWLERFYELPTPCIWIFRKGRGASFKEIRFHLFLLNVALVLVKWPLPLFQRPSSRVQKLQVVSVFTEYDYTIVWRILTSVFELHLLHTLCSGGPVTSYSIYQEILVLTVRLRCHHNEVRCIRRIWISQIMWHPYNMLKMHESLFQ